MKKSYFIKLENKNIMKDIFSLINSIIYAMNTNKKIIIFKNNYFDLKKINFLLNKHNIFLFDKNTTKFKINAVFYGESDNIIDITDMMEKVHIIPGNTYLSKVIVNDPSPGKQKQLYYNYSFDEYDFYETYNDYVENDIYFNIKNVYENQINDKIDYFDKSLFEEFIKIIHFSSFYNLTKIDHIKLNVIDARLYYIDNNPEIIQKIIEEIKTNINFSIDTFIICEDIINNPIIQYMNNNNYNYIVNIKNDDFKENEINDIMTAKLCTDVFIGAYNSKDKTGSIFTYFIDKNINPLKKILVY